VAVQTLHDGAFRFVRPDGRAFDSPAPGATQPSNWTQLPLQHRNSDICISPTAASTRWRGERMDYGLALDVLLAKDRRARCVPAGTS
jgi:hypothetical protein